MTHHSLFLPSAILALCLFMPATGRAQDDVQPQAESPKPAVATPAAKPGPTPPPPSEFNGTNVRIDVTITDQVANGKPTIKTLNAIVGHRQEAQIRTLVQVPVASPVAAMQDPKAPKTYRTEALPLDVDLYGEIVRPGRVRVKLSLNYRTATAAPGDAENSLPGWTASLVQSVSVFLDSGKPLVISQSADPATDRKVTIELKATILN